SCHDINVDGDTVGCDGGCEYGNECRYDSDLNTSECQPVIVDAELRAYVAANMITNADFKDSTTTTPSFSVASLRNITSDKTIVGTFASLTDLGGIEHIV
ncbi:hypothetical protein ADUPG1_005839, partial [Aduncisulcus paluster]